MVKCPECGAGIKYIPVGNLAVIIVEAEYIEVINDNGRVIMGHLRHQCPKIIEEAANERH